MDSIARSMPLGISLGAYRPNGSLAIDNWGLVDVPATKMICEWGSRGEWRRFDFTCPYVRMQWVPHYGNIGDTCSSILWYIPWQDWTRFSTSRFNLNIYCASSDLGGPPNTWTFPANSQSRNKFIHFPTPNPSRKHIDRPIIVTGEKYPKL